MRRWIILGILAVAVVAAAVLIERDIIETDWEFFGILAAPFVAVFKSISNAFKSREEEEELIRERYEERRTEAAARHWSVTSALAASEERATAALSEVEKVDSQIAELDRRRRAIAERVDEMSDDQLAAEARRLFGSSASGGR